MKLRHFTTNKILKEFASDDIEQAWEDAEYNYEQDTGKNWDDASRITQENYYAKALLNYGFKITANGIVRMESTESTNESLQALARHVKEGVPLVDSLFRYQSEAYFDTFKKAKQLREAGSLPELDWESEEMLATDIGESVELKGVGRVWLDVPYLNEDESIEEAQEGMIGEPDRYYDAEERKQAYNDLQDALSTSSSWQEDMIKDGICPECSGSSYMDGDDENGEDSCYGFGNYGCDEGEMEGATWKEIIDHDKRNADRQKAKANYPGDEEVIKQAARMMPNMDDPRMIVQQIRADYPQLGRAKASDLAAKAKQIAFPESVEIDQIKNLAGLNELKDERTDIQKIEDLLKDALGPNNSGGDMYELYAELESINSEQADEIKLLAKELYGVKLEENLDYLEKSKYKNMSLKMELQRVLAQILGIDDYYKMDVEDLEKQLKSNPANSTLWNEYSAYKKKLQIQRDDKVSPTIGNFASDNRDPRFREGKSPHKKGTKKYKKHMAAMHAEAVRGRPKIDGEATEIQKIKIGGVEREFIRKGEMWHSTDPKYPMTYGYNTPTGQKIAKGRANALAKTTPSYQAKLKKNKVMASEAEYQGKDVELNKPKRGGSKKYYVYVKNPKTGNVKKISFGDPGLKTKSGNKKRAKSFAARHNCEKKNDKMKAGYWACRLPRYGLVKGGKWW